MYDTRQEANEFVGDNLEDARAKAAEFFGQDAGDLKVVVAEDGEIFGAAGRTVIVAIPKSLAGRRPQSGGDGPRRSDDDRPRREARGDSRGGGRGPGRGEDRGDRGGRGEGRGREDRGGRGGRGEGRGREDRGGRENSRGRGGRGREERDGGRKPEREQLEPEVAKAVANSKGKAKGDLGPIGDFLLGAVELMKIGSFEISEASEGDFLIYQLTGPAAEALQQGDGRATDALQLVANQVSMRQSEDAPRIVVDVEGGGDEREDTLNRLSERAVKRARETGRSIALDPMNGRDRRAIHLAIRDEDDVATMSIGEGRYRQVLVVPEGAPEYDDAVAESSRS